MTTCIQGQGNPGSFTANKFLTRLAAGIESAFGLERPKPTAVFLASAKFE
jgi:hypothetical protein